MFSLEKSELSLERHLLVTNFLFLKYPVIFTYMLEDEDCLGHNIYKSVLYPLINHSTTYLMTLSDIQADDIFQDGEFHLYM